MSNKAKHEHEVDSGPACVPPPDAAESDRTTVEEGETKEVLDVERAPLITGLDFSDETQNDLAPIGPTEYAGAVLSQPSSEGSGGDASAHSSSVDQLEEQIRDLEARLDEMIGQNRPAAPKPERASAELPTGAAER